MAVGCLLEQRTTIGSLACGMLSNQHHTRDPLQVCIDILEQLVWRHTPEIYHAVRLRLYQGDLLPSIAPAPYSRESRPPTNLRSSTEYGLSGCSLIVGISAGHLAAVSTHLLTCLAMYSHLRCDGSDAGYCCIAATRSCRASQPRSG